jgi:two-component system sensor histidine kinase MprB
MSLRLRLASLASGAVAIAIVAAAIIAWLLIRSAMLGEVDARLIERASQADRIVGLTTVLPERDVVERRFITLVQGDPVGVQLVGPDGEVTRQVTLGPLTEALNDSTWDPPMPTAEEPRLDTVTLAGEPYRLLSKLMPDGTLMRLFQPIATIDATLARVTWSLAATAGAGIALAALLGWLVSRSALRPVDRLVAATERVSATKDLASRIEVDPGRRDEIGRLATSVNAMLVALDAARTQQRELIENAGHELRTPLAVLRNDLGLLARTEHAGVRTLAPAARRELIEDLDTQVAGLGHMVTELVELARGTAEPERLVRTDLKQLIDRAVAANRRVDGSVRMSVIGPSALVTVRPAMLERAVGNLVRNAIQSSPAGGRVQVELRPDGRWFRIEVRDRGHGFEPGEEPHLFERFFRGAASRGRVGSGLGLAIVAQAAEAHGGRVQASPRKGGGAVFTLSLPA